MHASSLQKLNRQRRLAKELPVVENHPCIYSKNKSSWKIEGKTFAIICHFSAMILHMRNVLVDMLATWVVQNQQSASTCPDCTVLSAYMSEWASTLTGIYTIAELKNEYTQCCSCMEETQGKSVVFANLPTRLGAFLKEHFAAFYEQFCVFEDEEEENSILSEDGEQVHNSETESEGEDGGINESIEEKQLEQEQSTNLEMFFCNEVVDEPVQVKGSPELSNPPAWMLKHQHLAQSQRIRKPHLMMATWLLF